MGRPAWANEEQWVWLKAQVIEYSKIKGTKETSKFWAPFLNEWQTKWPTPALTDIVNTGGSNNGTGESPADASGTPANTSETPASSGESADKMVCAVMLVTDSI